MSMAEVKVDRLEHVLEEFITNVGIEFNKLYNSQMRTEAELRAAKEDTQAFKNEMRVYREDTQTFKDEMRQLNKDMNIKWGEMANRLGTIVEDLVAPSIPRIIKEEFGLEVTDLMVRRRKKLQDGTTLEYDAIAATDGHVYLNSTKSKLRSLDIDRFIDEIEGFKKVFPEYKKDALIGIAASLYVDESVITYAEKKGFLVLSTGDQLMEVKNTKGFKPKTW